MSQQDPDPPTPNQTSPMPKAIGSLAKNVTRQGTQKLKFTPTLPQRRSTHRDRKPESTAATPHDRGRGSGKGKGEGKGAATSSRGPPEMTASGPFSLGPSAMSKTPTTRRSMPQSNSGASGAPVLPPQTPGAGPSQATVSPTLKREKDRAIEDLALSHEEKSTYSDPDDGVKIVDMEDIKQSDRLVPESLVKDRNDWRRRRGIGAKNQRDQEGKEPEHSGGPKTNLTDALDLSESEEEEYIEDLAEYFTQTQLDEEPSGHEALYLFQFPSPFPTFLPRRSAAEGSDAADHQQTVRGSAKLLSLSEEEKPATAGPSGASASSDTVPKEQPNLEGIIGRLEVYNSGAIKMVLGNDIVLDVNPAIDSSFLQQAAHLDLQSKRLCVLGEIKKCFVVSPNVDAMLGALEDSRQAQNADRHSLAVVDANVKAEK